ncbi:glycosyltransferase [Aquihabitans sp. McL0605]|uniref:glycosyltransferase n=1 Tax=Aquihabitans sp. McL0605 TaxID=3415671 RepID=UPI003CEEDE4C
MGPARDPLDLLWLALPESRPGRELSWLASMPDASVSAVGEAGTGDPVPFIERPYRRLTRRFIEAGALAWFQDLDTVDPGPTDWVASLELCALVTGQAGPLAQRLGARQAILTWGNDARNPLYRIPPYHQALKRAERADLVVCLIEAARDHCLELGFSAEQLRVVLPPLDTARFHPPEQPVEEPVAAFISPLATNKGIDRVLDAWPLVTSKVPEARLVVAGRGPLDGLVRERAASDPSIEFVGSLPGDGVAELLRRVAVFVTAPRPTRVWNEQFGLAYVEAMASGVPVVTTECGTNHEAVLAPSIRVPDDAGRIAEGLIHFLGDPALRRSIFPELRRVVVDRFERSQQLAALRAAFDSVG